MRIKICTLYREAENNEQQPAPEASTSAADPAVQRQKETSTTAVIDARVRSAVARVTGGRVPPPTDTKVLRKMQERELNAKVKESEANTLLLQARAAKEQAQTELLKQRKEQEAELHKQKLANEEEMHYARLVDLGVEPEDLRSRLRPMGTDAQVQTDE